MADSQYTSAVRKLAHGLLDQLPPAALDEVVGDLKLAIEFYAPQTQPPTPDKPRIVAAHIVGHKTRTIVPLAGD